MLSSFCIKQGSAQSGGLFVDDQDCFRYMHYYVATIVLSISDEGARNIVIINM